MKSYLSGKDEKLSMTVKELIKELEKFDEDLPIWFDYCAGDFAVELTKNYDGDNVVLLW